ncbi:HAMP domain-containing protein [Phormidium tenue FACHB-886]|nr:HAMP domain-containing protein [Phormidium tenue FACHB-886]
MVVGESVKSQFRIRLKSIENIPLKLVLVVPFVLQVSIAVGLTGYFSIRNGQRAVADLAMQLRQGMSDRIDQHLNDFILSGRQVAQLNAKMIQLKALDPENLDQLGRYFWEEMQTYNLGYVNLVSESGNFVGAGRFDYNSPVTIDLLSPKRFGNNDVYIYKTNSQGEFETLNQISKSFDFRKEAWYQQTVKEKRPIWSLYQWSSAPYHLSLAATYPIYDTNNQLKYISWTELRLWEISKFLKALPASPSSRTFVLERNALLVGSSAQEFPYHFVKGKPQRLYGTESEDLLIREASRYLVQQFRDLNQIQSAQHLEFWQNGERQFLQVTPWQDEWGLDWLMVVVVPESDFMGQVQANTRTTIGLCLLALGLSIILGLYTSRWIAQPIASLSSASKAIAAGQGHQVTHSNNIQELKELTESFNMMIRQVRDSFQALELANQNLEQANITLEDRVSQRTQELSEALKDLRHTQSQLIQTEKMSSLGQMVAGVAHEINNPVNFIHGNLEYACSYVQDLLGVVELYQKHHPQPSSEIEQFIQEADLPFLMADTPKIMQSMQEGTRRIREIVLGLRNFSRLDESEKKEVDLHQGLDNTLMILEYRFKSKQDNSEVQIVKQYGKLPMVECYPGQMNQVFLNLLVNALDAIDDHQSQISPKKRDRYPGRITISTEVKGNRTALIRIADNGVGIPECARFKLFDPFFTTKPVGEGTGLGLSISYQIVVGQHGGKLDYSSSPGQGTEFVIEIPLSAA